MVEWTCSTHYALWYELCRAGGLMFIRRCYRPGKDRPIIKHSDAWPEREARKIWADLLTGKVC